MAIFIDRNSRVIVQGMTGTEGMKHTRRMLAAGTDVVGGVNPRKAGLSVTVDGRTIPVFGSVKEALAATDADVTVVFVPPPFVRAAVDEASDAGIGIAVVITEGVPVHDTVAFRARAASSGTRLIGPNCPGLISPGQS
ncbi:MAG: succinyl-CoA synthetase alpha subunit, partial [Streptomyces sp.]|nr:succinyl-CoA synthetase alpha subunit [Streptomyces sp.]